VSAAIGGTGALHVRVSRVLPRREFARERQEMVVEARISDLEGSDPSVVKSLTSAVAEPQVDIGAAGVRERYGRSRFIV